MNFEVVKIVAFLSPPKKYLDSFLINNLNNLFNSSGRFISIIDPSEDFHLFQALLRVFCKPISLFA